VQCVELENFGEDLLLRNGQPGRWCGIQGRTHIRDVLLIWVSYGLWSGSGLRPEGWGRAHDRAREPPFLKLWPLSQAEPVSVVFVAVILYLLLHQLYTEREDEQGWQQQQRWPSIRTA
jgi:hypothetical protein